MLIFAVALSCNLMIGLMLVVMRKKFMQKHEELLKFAFVHLRTAKICLAAKEDSVIVNILYHTNQSAEKTLKAFLVYNRKSLRKTHDLVELLNACGKVDSSFYELLSEAIYLNPFAMEICYPNKDLCLLIQISYADHVVKVAEKCMTLF